VNVSSCGSHCSSVTPPLDTVSASVHNRSVLPNRLTIPDARGRGASLRVTRHSEQRKIVVSHWRDGLCVASTPIELSEIPALIGVLADALGDAVDTTGRTPVAPPQRWSLLSAVRGWLWPKLAHVTELRSVRESHGEEKVG
jgi:hypothetical protein